MAEEDTYKISMGEFIGGIGHPVVCTTVSYTFQLTHNYTAQFFLLIPDDECTLCWRNIHFKFRDEDLPERTTPDGFILDSEFMHKSALLQAESELNEYLEKRIGKYMIGPRIELKDAQVVWSLWLNGVCRERIREMLHNSVSASFAGLLRTVTAHSSFAEQHQAGIDPQPG
jgi:hypothetical protein